MLKAEDESELKKLYRTVRGGLGFNKEPHEWRAFPQDAYSHTLFGGGAKQPGMTGQVKEEIITRFSELGVIIENGQITFDCNLVYDGEFLSEKTDFEFVRIDNQREKISLDKNMLAFTFCQTPVVYKKCQKSEITVEYMSGESVIIKGNTLPCDLSKSVFERENTIRKIIVCV